MESQIIDDKTGGNNEKKFFDRLREIKAVRVPFMFLSLDLPPPPLFQDESEKNIIPQVKKTPVNLSFSINAS